LFISIEVKYYIKIDAYSMSQVQISLSLDSKTLVSRACCSTVFRDGVRRLMRCGRELSDEESKGRRRRRKKRKSDKWW
jgi:hypothetical protein